MNPWSGLKGPSPSGRCWRDERFVAPQAAVGVLSYAAFTFADVVISDLQWPNWYHWLHGYGISVALAFATVVLFFGQPQVQTGDQEACASPVDMNPWSMAKPIAVMIALVAVGLYVGLLLLSSD